MNSKALTSLKINSAGGVSQICLRYAEAHNQYMSNYQGDGSERNQKYIVYWDMVNLYGTVMQEYLPVRDFVFLNEGKVASLKNQKCYFKQFF